MKGGKSGKASGRTLPVFDTSKPHILAWLQRLVGMLKVKDPKAIDPSTPLFLSRVRNKDGSPRAIARETAWHIIKAIARENEFSGKVGTQSTRKTLAGKVYTWSNDIRVVQGILSHRSLASTEAYLKSLTDREVWTAFRTAAALYLRWAETHHQGFATTWSRVKRFQKTFGTLSSAPLRR
jgi:site-specific recombinase XerD